LSKLRRSDRFETYAGSVANYFDPHTDYFSPKDKEDFDINMGGKLEGIGARLQQEDDYIKVSTIIVGGPAWKGKELEEGDLIIAVAQEGKKAEDIVGWRSDDAVQLIRGPKGTKVTLTIKRKDGTIKDITIERDEVIIDESFARSLLIDIPNVMNNVQYIKLPKFYSSFEKEDGNSCAKDIANELEKAKLNNANGIILDLRNNSGGSLNDVVDMSGLFIEQGPIVQVKSKDTPPYIYNDRDSRVQYNGPVIVMVNAMSASASEILAAALQDYGRAIIVGGNSTFGKGSVQRFFDLDQLMRGNDNLKPLGSVKMSVQKFFRINGGSTQLKGVVPDIIFPDNFSKIDAGEKEYSNPLAYTEIDKLTYNQNVAKIQNLSAIKSKSMERIKNDKNFQLASENAVRLKETQDLTLYPIGYGAYSEAMVALEEKSKNFEKLFKEDIVGLSVRNLEQDKEYIDSDESRKARNEDWIKGIKKDFYLYETMLIMKDMIETEPSFASLAKKIKQ
jgi:carboxyl-terminal processing protease